jgi:hypothetical protein
MFCGWQLYSDLPRLENYGSGILEIDIKNITAQVNGTQVKNLNMPVILNSWFLEDLLKNNINIELVSKAFLKVEFEITPQPRRGKLEIKSKFKCIGILESGSDRYISEVNDAYGDFVLVKNGEYTSK